MVGLRESSLGAVYTLPNRPKARSLELGAELNQWIHSSSFLFSTNVEFGNAGPEKAKSLAGKSPPPDSDPSNDAEF